MDKMSTLGLIIILVTIGFFSKELIKLWRLLIEFMFNQESRWYNKYIEKPRTLLHIFALFFVLVAFFLLRGLFIKHVINYTDIFIGVFIYIGGILILLFTYSKKFECIFIPLVEKTIQNNNKTLIFKNLEDDSLHSIFFKMEQLEQLPCENDEKQKLIDKLTLFYKEKPTKEKSDTEKINIAIPQKNGQVSYHPIFYFLNEIIEDGIIDIEINKKDECIYYALKGSRRKQLTNLIIKFFKKGGESIKESSLSTAYTSWVSKYNKNQAQ